MKWNPAFTPGPWYYAHGEEHCFNPERVGIVGVIGLEASDGPSYTPEQAESMDPDLLFDVTICELMEAGGPESVVAKADGELMALAPELAHMVYRLSETLHQIDGTEGEPHPLVVEAQSLLARVPQKKC